MSLELSSIAFKVETSELDTAVKKLGDLQKAVTSLNKPIASTTLATEKLAQAQAKTAKEQAKAEEAANKAALAQAKLEKTTTSNTAAQEKLKKSTEATSEATRTSVSALERQQQILEFMTQGFSKGQSSVLTYAKTTGALTTELEELGRVLQTQRKLVGGDPFDKSTGGLESLKNKLTEAREANRLYTAGIDLTSSQTKELARDKERIIEKMKLEGASLTDIKNKLREHNAAYIAVADAVNKLDRAEQAKITTDRTVVKSLSFVEREIQRAENALVGLNENMLISSSNRLLKFKEGLAASGMASDEAAKRYAAYAKVISDTDAKRRTQQASDEQARINNLSRGLAPQISDVAVSLYGGMSPMTVLMQQGLQVRDLIQSSGVEADKLNEVLKKTGADFLGTLSGTFKAVGSLVVGVFQSAGASTAKFIGDVTGLSGAFEYLRYQVALMEKDTDKVTSVLGKFGSVVLNSAIPMIATGLAGLAIAAVTAAVALKQLIAEESNFSKVLNLNGAALGINRDAAYTLATTYAGARGDINGYVVAMTEAAKAGNISSDSLKTVTDSAVYMKSVAGVAIEDTVKQFSELAKDPVKAIEKVAISLGTIDPEIVKVVRSLKEQGKEAEAAAIATTAYAEGLAKAGAMIKTDMGFLESFFKTIGSAASSMWDKILNVGREGTLQQQIDSAKEKIRSLSAGEGIFILSDRNVTLGIEKARLEGLEKELEAQKKLNDQKQRNVELIKSDSDVNALLDQYAEKSDKKKKAIEEVNNVFDKSIRLAKESGLATAEIEANRAKALAGIEEKFRVRTKKDPQENYFANLMLEAEKATVKATDATDELTKSQERMLVLIKDPKFLALPEAKKSQALASFAAAAGQEAENKEWEAANKIMDDTAKAMKQATIEADKLAKARKQRGDSEIINAQNKLQLLDEELADMLLQKAIYGDLTAEQKKQIEYAKIQKEYKAEELRITKLLADPMNNISDVDAQKLRDINYEAAAKKRQNIDQAIILENNEYEYEQRVQLAAGISSSIETALFEGGQAGSKKLRDVIEAELRKPITLFIQAFVQDIFGLNGAGDTMSKAMSAFDKVSSFFSSGGTNNLVSSGLTKLMSSEVGYKLGLANPTGYTTGSGVSYSANSTGSMLSKTAGQVGGAMTAYGLQKGLSGGYKTGESKLVDAATAIAGFFDPTGGLIAGTIGAAVNRAFGRKLTETGIEGTFGGSQGFTGNQYSFEKGGWFRSDRTKTSAMDSGMQQGFADQFNTLRAGIAIMSTSLGLGTKSIEDFTYKFKLNLMGLSEADATKKLKEEFDKVGVAITDTLPELAKYKTANETSLDTLTRLASSLGNVNSAFDMLGFGLKELSVSGAAAASTIIEAYGGLDKFNQTMSAYYDAFYSDEEKTTKTLSNFSDVFKSVGVDVADVSLLTKDGFRAIVDNLVATKGAADPAVVALMRIAPAFANVADAASAATSQMQEAWISILATRDEGAANAYSVKNLFDKYKATDKYGIKNASDFLSISENDFKKNYSSEQQQIIKQIIQALTPKETKKSSNSSSNSSDKPDSEPIKDAVDQIAETLLKTRSDLEVELLRAQGKEAEALLKQKAIETQGYSAAQLALYEYNQSLKVQIEVLNKAKAIANERKNLESELLQAQGDTVKLREIELAALDQSNRAIKKQIYAIQDRAKAEEKAKTAVDTAYSLLKKSVDSQKEVLDQQIYSLENTEATLQNLFDLISSNVKELYSEVTSTAFANLKLSYGIISNAINSGILPSQNVLAEAITSVRGSFDNNNFSSKYESDKARLSFASDLEKLQKLSSVQISDSQQQIKLLKEQVIQYDNILLTAEKQINELRGINNSILSISDSIDNLTSAIKVESNLTTTTTTNTRTDNPTLDRSFNSGRPTYGNLNDTQSVFARSYAQSLQWGTESTDAQSTVLLADYAKLNGISQADLADVLGFSPEQIKSHFNKYGIPSFATGGVHSGGIRIVGENGPELELTGPSRIYNASQTASILSGNSNLDETSMLRYEVRAVASSTAKLTRIIERLIIGTNTGEALQVKTTV